MNLPPRLRNERGAAAVEFALVVPLLLALVFGIIDYGLWFSDTLSARAGVREAARQGVVQNYGTCGELKCLAELTKDRIGAVSGETYVKISVVQNPRKRSGWREGNDLLVCAVVSADGVTGLTPLPKDGGIRTETRMRIEQDDSPPGGTSYADAAPPGGWSGCG